MCRSDWPIVLRTWVIFSELTPHSPRRPRVGFGFRRLARARHRLVLRFGLGSLLGQRLFLSCQRRRAGDRDHLGDRLAPQLGDVLGAHEPAEPLDRRTRHVDRSRRAEALREHVADAGELEHRSHATAGDDAGSLAGRTENDPRRVELPDDLVRDRLPVLRDLEEVLLRVLDGLRDGERDLPRLPVAEPDPVDLVPDDDERGEREPPAALHDLGDAVDLDDPLLQLTGVGDFPGAQNFSPSSRAPSASAFTRPWYR